MDLIELFDLNGSEYFGAYIAYVLRKGVPENTVSNIKFNNFIEKLEDTGSDEYKNLEKFLENHDRIPAEKVSELLKTKMPDFLGKIKNIIGGKSEPLNLVEDKKQFESFLIYFGNETINPNLPEEIGYFRNFSKAICITKKNGECVLDEETETRFYEQQYNDAFDQIYYINEDDLKYIGRPRSSKGGSRKRNTSNRNKKRNTRKRNSRRRKSSRRNSSRRNSRRRISRRSRRISRRRNNRSIKKRNN